MRAWRLGGWLLPALLLVAVLLLAGCAAGPARAPQAQQDQAGAGVLTAYLAAFNAHDADAVGQYLAPDLVWLAIDGEQLREEARGRDAMVAWLRGYFSDLPDVRAEMRLLQAGSQHVAVHECLSWSRAGERQRQCALGAYQIEAGLIRRVWYWPAE